MHWDLYSFILSCRLNVNFFLVAVTLGVLSVVINLPRFLNKTDVSSSHSFAILVNFKFDELSSV